MRRNWGARVHEVTLRGMSTVVLENELLRVTVLAGKGSDVVEFNAKRRDLDFVWLSPMGLRNPADVAGGSADDLASFVDVYPGGWQVVFPSGGAPSAYRGAILGQHAEVAILPWDHEILQDTAEAVSVRFSVTTPRLPVKLTRTFRLAAGVAELDVHEELANSSPVELDTMWGQHIAFGRPFLRPGCRIRLPDGVHVVPHPTAITPPHRRVAPGGPWPWPRVPAPDGGTVDLSVIPDQGEPSDIVYLTGFTDGWYEVVDTDRDAGLRVAWDARVLPYLWLWQEQGASVDYPWWGRAYTTGLEPFSSFPTNGLADAVANGTAMRLAPHATKVLRWSATVLDGGGHG